MHKEIARCIYGFGVGVVLNWLYERVVNGQRYLGLGVGRYTLLEVAAAAALLAEFLSANTRLPVHLIAPLAFAPAIFIFSFDAGWISR